MADVHHNWIQTALVEAQAALPLDVPVGAIIVKDGVVIAKAHNRREVDNNPVAHAEILALQEAGRVLGDWRLTGCTLYVTLEPCPMCAAAIAQARVSQIVFGAYDLLAGACGSKENVFEKNTTTDILGGILETECQQALKAFFQSKR